MVTGREVGMMTDGRIDGMREGIGGEIGGMTDGMDTDQGRDHGSEKEIGTGKRTEEEVTGMTGEADRIPT